jgi:hypothetical protein
MRKRLHLPLYAACLLCFFFVFDSRCRAFAGGVGGCFFHGDCDVAWKLNQAFDSGLRGKSEAIVGPLKEAYFEVAKDLFDNRIGPMIADVDTRLAGRLSQAQNIVQEAAQAIDKSLDKAKSLIEETDGDVNRTIQEAEKFFDQAMTRVEQDIKSIDCVLTKAAAAGDDIAQDLWGKFILNAIVGLTNSCNWIHHNIFNGPGDALPSYRAAKCILERQLESSKTVQDVMTYYARLGGVASYYTCKFSGQPGADEASRDLIAYTQAYKAWALTLGND